MLWTRTDFVVVIFEAVYCLVDDLVEGLLERGSCRLRARGRAPALDDREITTIEVAGEFLGFDTDKGIF